MTSRIKADTILPQSGTTLQLGNAGSTINVTGTLDGNGLTGLNADNISSGTLANARLSGQVVLTTDFPTYTSVSPTTIEPNTASDLTITGTNFVSVPVVELISGTGAILRADKVTFNSSTSLTANVNVATQADYFIRIENNNGQSVRSTNADLAVSQAPSFTTAAGSLGTFDQGSAISVDVSATSDSAVNITLVSGSLPTGLSLGSTVSNTAAISGTESGSDTSDTAYNFTLRATDAESQTSDRAFSITISAGILNGGMFT
jgi:hypothetical protein